MFDWFKLIDSYLTDDWMISDSLVYDWMIDSKKLVDDYLIINDEHYPCWFIDGCMTNDWMIECFIIHWFMVKWSIDGYLIIND